MVAQARRLDIAGVIVVGGTGDLVLDLAASGLDAQVHAPDPDDAALTELKLVAARMLPAQSVQSFLGLAHFGRRVWFYHHIRDALSGQTRAWGDARETMFRLGLLGGGRFERTVHQLRTLLRVDRASGPGWELLLRGLGSGPVRRRSGLGATAGPGGPATWVRQCDPGASPWCERLATGSWADPAAAHPWMGPEGLARVKADPPRVRSELGPVSGLLVLPEAAEFSDDATWLALRRACLPGSHVLVWERWRRRELAGADAVEDTALPDRSPLHARARLWRVNR